MKRALIAAAAGAIGALGTAGLMSAAPASAGCASPVPDPGATPPVVNPGYTPPLTPARVVCVIGEQTGTFFMSVSPATQLDTFLNGASDDTPFGSLGVLHQPETFVNSIVGPGGFLDGPRSPE
jgi:hypothetical protein